MYLLLHIALTGHGLHLSDERVISRPQVLKFLKVSWKAGGLVGCEVGGHDDDNEDGDEK